MIESRPARQGAPIDRASALWWVFLLRGVAGILLAISVLAGGEHPARLATFIAAYWLIGAALTVRWALGNRWLPGSRLAFVAGFAGLIAATLVLVRKVLEGTIPQGFAIRMLGVAAILTGVLRLAGAFH